MIEEMYVVGMYKDGKREGFISAGRPSTIRVYTSYASAKRGITGTLSSNRRYGRENYEFKILAITGLTGVVEE